MDIREMVFDMLGFDGEVKIDFCSYDGVFVKYREEKAVVGYLTKPQQARALMLLVKNISEGKKSFEIEQKAAFDELGVMIDVSRNAVLRVSAVKEYLKYMALLGMNYLMLYTEDIYEIPKYPFFGYLRGRYQAHELKEIIGFAQELGIEVIPCIQTLSHLETVLRWEAAKPIADTANTLLADSPDTYAFIEEAIKTIRAIFKTDKIHIGMDEASDMGFGAYYRNNGRQDRNMLFERHLKKVCAICEKNGFHPMIWSDMLFKLEGNIPEDYSLDAKIPAGAGEMLPDVDLVFWDYYHKDSAFYGENIKRHQSFGKKIIFAGAVWTCDGFIPNFGYTYETMKAALPECIKRKVGNVLATMWGNDGSETNWMLTVHCLPVFSEYCYLGADCDYEAIASMGEYLTRSDRRWTEAVDAFHLGKDGATSVGKRFIYCDPLYNLLKLNIDCGEVIARYERSLAVIRQYGEKSESEYYALLFEIALRKCRLVRDLQKEYKNGNQEYLRSLAQTELLCLRGLYERLLLAHKNQWMATNKPNGFEVLNVRYGGAMARIDYAIAAIEDYLNKKTDKIEELEDVIDFSLTKEKWIRASDLMFT